MTYSMRRVSKWSSDPGLATRMLLVMGLLTLVYLGFIAVLVSSGVDAVTVLLIAVVMAGVQYFFSDRIALASVGAKVVDPQQAPELHAMVERLAALADVPKPKVAIVDTPVPNAFAAGRSPRASVVAVTTGLMRTLEPREVEAVLAHEIAHVRNRDVMVMTIASFFAVVAQLVVRWLSWGGSWSSGGRGRRSGSGLVIIYLASLVVWVISFFLIRALSRYREFAADRGAALLTGAPSALMSALLKISGMMQRIPDRDLREVSELNAFFILPAVKGSSFFELFSTHPSLDRRLDRLRELARQMEGV
jgi:heat shock protein HtpX